MVRMFDRDNEGKTVGVLRVRRLSDSLRIDDWWMDDAALVRGLEGQVLRDVGRRAVAAGVALVELAHVPSHRNEPVRRFFGTLGVECSRGEYLVPVGVAFAAGAVEVAPPRTGRPAAVDFYRRAAGALSTPAGVLRAMSRRGVVSDMPPAASYRLPRTHTERWLSGVWRELLGVDRVGPHDDFFALGGDSLAGARSIARVRSAFGVALSLRELYEEPTLEAQAARLMRARLAHADPSVVRSLLAEDAAWAEAA
jgi:aryl carrier-like protein